MVHSIYEEAKGLATSMGGIISLLDVQFLPAAEKKLVVDIQRALADVRLDARDYEYAETRAEQQLLAHDARKRFEQLNQDILAASEYNIFNAVDVALYSSKIQHIILKLV